MLALAAVLLVPAGSPAGAETRASIGYAHNAVSATDTVRANRGMSTFVFSDCLARLAWAQAHRMARQHRLFHQDLGVPMSTCHLTYAGENVASGFATGSKVVYDGWMKSPPHRANILSIHYRLMAIGAVRSDDGRWYVSQVFGRHA